MKLWSKLLGALLVCGAALSTNVLAQAISFDNTNAQDVQFPDMDKAWLKKGAVMDPMHPRSMGLGLTKNQVRSIIQHPHFSEGVFGPDVWNYIFNFKKSDGTYLTCQYQVHFKGDNGTTSGLYWDREECLKFVNAKPAKTETHPLVLASDGLFAFGRSGFNDLQSTGRENLRNLAGQIKVGYKALRGIEVVGYTDRIGSDESNMALSLARANTVKQYLVSQGIPANLIRTQGGGESKPQVFCEGAATPAVIACLMPNRRIEVSVNGDL